MLNIIIFNSYIINLHFGGDYEEDFLMKCDYTLFILSYFIIFLVISLSKIFFFMFFILFVIFILF